LGSLNSDLQKANTTLQDLNQQMKTVNADIESVRNSTQQFDGFLGGLRTLLGNLTGKK
jgi:prefoldin subunit 5